MLEYWSGGVIEYCLLKPRLHYSVAPTLRSLRSQQLTRHRSSRLADLVDLLFRLIFEFIELIQGQKIFTGDHAVFLEPLCFHIQPPRPNTHTAGENLLSVVAQQPVDKNSGRVWMRLIFKYDEMSIAAAYVKY